MPNHHEDPRGGGAPPTCFSARRSMSPAGSTSTVSSSTAWRAGLALGRRALFPSPQCLGGGFQHRSLFQTTGLFPGPRHLIPSASFIVCEVIRVPKWGANACCFFVIQRTVYPTPPPPPTGVVKQCPGGEIVGADDRDFHVRRPRVRRLRRGGGHDGSRRHDNPHGSV